MGSARHWKLAQEFVAGFLRRWPDPAGSLADHPSDKILRRVQISEKKKGYPSGEMEKYNSDMKCYLDHRFAAQGHDNICRLLSRIEQGKLVIGVKSSRRRVSEIHQQSGGGITSDEVPLHTHMENGVHGPKFLLSVQPSGILPILVRDFALQGSVS
jgi:hypothetical protein